MVSSPRFLNERLSVVCTWSDLSAIQVAKPTSSQQVPDVHRVERELSPAPAEWQQWYNMAEIHPQVKPNYILQM